MLTQVAKRCTCDLKNSTINNSTYTQNKRAEHTGSVHEIKVESVCQLGLVTASTTLDTSTSTQQHLGAPRTTRSSILIWSKRARAVCTYAVKNPQPQQSLMTARINLGDKNAHEKLKSISIQPLSSDNTCAREARTWAKMKTHVHKNSLLPPSQPTHTLQLLVWRVARDAGWRNSKQEWDLAIGTHREELCV